MTKTQILVGGIVAVFLLTRKQVRAAVPAVDKFVQNFADLLDPALDGYPTAKSAVDDLIGAGVTGISASVPFAGTPGQQNIGWLDAQPPAAYLDNPNLPSGNLPLFVARSPADWS